MAQKKQRITAEDLYRMQLVFDPQISPDGRHVIFCVQRVDQDSEKKYSNLWLVPTDGGEPRQFSYGDQTDTHPRWSPDGRQIAFLSDREDEDQPQIYLISSDGGEAQPLTDMKGKFANFEWSPDSQRLLCQFRKKDREAIARQEDEQKKKLGIVVHHITRLDYKLDGVGYLPKERWHIWTIDAGTGEGKQLTDSEKYDELMPRWSPDGAEILFFSNRSQRPDVDIHLVDLFVTPAGGGEFRKIETPVGVKSHGSFSPDGRWIAYLAREGKGNFWRNTNVWLVPADGSGPARNLTGKLDVEVDSSSLTDTGSRPLVPPRWSADGQRLYFHVTRHGDTRLCSLSHDGSQFQTVIADGVVGMYQFDRAGTKLAYFHGDIQNPGQVWLRDMTSAADGRARKLTRFNEAWLNEIDLGQIEEVWVQGAAGNELQGWILKPPGFDEGKKYPSILEIHGGPLAQYGRSFMHEFYFLAAQGYVVHFSNPRGGQGYGEAHSKAIHHNWGSADYDDLMAWTDFVAQKPYIDRQRMGVTGGSYGGYMTTWIIGHTDRFKAAVAQRLVSNGLSFWGSSDIGHFFGDSWCDEPPWQAWQTYWDQSPIKYIGNVKTPTLIVHSQQDLRCAQEQGEQVFAALRKLGVDTEMILFPEEPHGLSRSGRTDRRVVRLNHIRRWFDKYLNEQTSPQT
jgi:dipeptidyl aminopeptidase/acylaminoacyl peptidase